MEAGRIGKKKMKQRSFRYGFETSRSTAYFLRFALSSLWIGAVFVTYCRKCCRTSRQSGKERKTQGEKTFATLECKKHILLCVMKNEAGMLLVTREVEPVIDWFLRGSATHAACLKSIVSLKYGYVYFLFLTAESIVKRRNCVQTLYKVHMV